MEFDVKYMRRALQLAANGRGFTAPNPMVGAVIVAPDGRVIGEGWHRLCGQGHAEVNAVASVSEADQPLLRQSTIYVTLEPCSHYGKTPPCAKLLIDKQIPRVVVGAGDPNPKVNGRGIAMLREAGAEVVTGVLAEESEELNRVFFTAQRRRRPYITLKWAQSADGFMDVKRDGGQAYKFSTPLTQASTMRLRALSEAILTTAATVNADNPSLTLRGWPGRPPRRFILDRSGSLDTAAGLSNDPSVTVLRPSGKLAPVSEDGAVASCKGVEEPFRMLFEDHGVTSVLVEAGPRYLSALLEAGLWDELRVEISPDQLGDRGAHPAPAIPCPSDSVAMTETTLDSHRILHFLSRHY